MYLEATRETKLSNMSATRRIWREKATWMRCKYLYLKATREMKLSEMTVTRRNLAGKGQVDVV